MKIMEQLEKLADIFDSREQSQKELTVFEAGHIWGVLTKRYDIIEGTQILRNFTQDPDFGLILNTGLGMLHKQVDKLEKLMRKNSIALPPKPPATAESTLKVEVISDRWIFSVVFSGVQNCIFCMVEAFVRTSSPQLRELFLKFLNNEAAVYDRLFVYGQLKGWLPRPPAYRV